MENLRALRPRLSATAILVLIALGGAGLAVAADKPQNPLQRPELTWHADRQAAPWIRGLAVALDSADGQVVAVSGHGRRLLGSLQALDLATVNRALTEGDATLAALEGEIATLVATRDVAVAQVAEWRLGPQTRDLVTGLKSATSAAQQVPGHWRLLAADAQQSAGLVDALLRHDGLVFSATTAGRQSQWNDALALLDQAAAPLAEATRVRDSLAATGNVATLDDLLARARAYDSALYALYAYIRETGNESGPEFEALRDAVAEAQEALPADTSAMSAIVAEAAGPSLTASLVAIEQAHGEILQALAAVRDAMTTVTAP